MIDNFIVFHTFLILLLESYDKKIAEYYQKADYINLEKTCTLMLKYRPENSDIYNNLGLAYFMQKKYEPAETMYQKAIALTPQKASFYDNLGLLYQAKGNNEQASIFFKKACDLGNTVSCK